METRRFRAFRAGLVKTLLILVSFDLPIQGAANSAPLKVLISVEEQNIAAPFPMRVTLHLHNAGDETLWLYRHARDQLPVPRRLLEEDTGPLSTGGSMLAVKLEPVIAGQAAISNPAQGAAFKSVGLPKPKLVRLAPGEDYEEKTSIRVTARTFRPAKTDMGNIPAYTHLQGPVFQHRGDATQPEGDGLARRSFEQHD